jgi:hypothetical protein
MRVFISMAVLAIAVHMQAAGTQAACNCGPDFCQDDSRIGAKLAAKTARMTSILHWRSNATEVIRAECDLSSSRVTSNYRPMA